jgi:hypothetical protein
MYFIKLPEHFYRLILINATNYFPFNFSNLLQNNSLLKKNLFCTKI